jgi:hypothetical protein
MPTIMQMHWPEVSKEQYDQARQEVNWENQPADGGKFHVAWFPGDGLHVMDVWESAAHFQRFVEQRLMPGVAKLGIKGQPKVQLSETHAVWSPPPKK